MKAPVSAVVITRNEERHIQRCLDSVSWAAESIVVDSKSEDRTVELAKRMGAQIFLCEWAGYSAQKNFGIDQATQPWVLNIDADEVVTDHLRAEILSTLAEPEIQEAGFRIRVPLYFLGRQLGHYGRAAQDPGRLRLFRTDRARFDGAIVHEKVVVDGSVGTLREVIFHDSYPSPALQTYRLKIHHYSRLEAKQRVLSGDKAGGPWLRALGRLGWMLIVRRGLLHGLPAWIWIAGQAYQEWLTTAETRRLRRSAPQPPLVPRSTAVERDAV